MEQLQTDALKKRKNLAYVDASEKIDPRLQAHSHIFEKKIYVTADCIYTAMGWAVETPTMIVANEGIIIIDPCESHDSMAEIMEEFRKISDLPIRCVVYTHHHPDHWGGVTACVSQEEVDGGSCIVVAQEGFAKGVALMTGILADIKIARSLYMYGYMLPEGDEGRVNLGLGPMMRKDFQGYIAPTHLVASQLNLTVCDLDMEFYHIPSECTDEICIWFPQKKVLHVAECIQGENFPNIYSIRGSNRDAEKWVASIDLMRQFPAVDLVGSHMRPVHGADEAAAHLRDYRDMIQYTHDQTVRLMNQGYTPGNIVEMLGQLPPHLFQRPRMGEHYGTFMQTVRQVYNQYLGWFTGDAAQLQPLPPGEAAGEYLALIGREQLLQHAKAALEQQKYRWAAELLTIPVQANHDDMEARGLKALALRQLAYQTENGPFRNWYLTQAMNLEGHFEQIKQAMPDMNGPGVYFEAIKQVGTEFILDCLKVKLNGFKTQDVNRSLTITFTDQDFSKAVEIRRGIMEIHENENYKTDGEIKLTRETFDLVFVRLKSIDEMMKAGAIETTLSQKEVESFFACFDPFTPLFDMEFPFE